MATGLRYLRHTPVLQRLIVVTALFSLTSGSVQPLLPSLADGTLGLGARGYGFLFACFGAGALVGALTRQRVNRRVGPLMIPGAVVLFGVAGIGLGLSRLPIVSGALLSVLGACWVWTLATVNSAIQLSSPRWVRGRAMGIYSLFFAGLVPVGALVAGAVAEVTGAATAILVFCAGATAVGLLAPRAQLPALTDLVEPTMPDDWSPTPHDVIQVAGGPVVVVTEWEIEPDDLQEFLAVMRELRRHRRRTGAVRWVLFRNAEQPNIITEVFEAPDWDEHLRQHARLDGDAVAVVLRARTFDRNDGPRTRHLVGIDVSGRDEPPLWEELLAVHAELHDRDGSIPVRERGSDSVPQRSRG